MSLKYQRRENECKAENIFEEIIVENFTNLIKDINVQIQKICRRLLVKAYRDRGTGLEKQRVNEAG